MENRPGSSGAIGSAIVARAEPDGYTLLIGGAGPMFTSPAVNPNVGYDPLRDFTHIAMIAGDGYVITASPGSGIKTFADMVSAAHLRPLTTGSPGAGSLAHLIIEELRRDLKIDLQHVPYRSAADTLTSLMGNHVDLSIQSFSSVGAMLRDHRIAAIAVTDRTRAAAFPDVPSLGELGHPDIGGVAWFWLAAPAHLPPAIVAKLNGQVRRIVALPNIAQRFEADALLTKDFDPAALNQFVVDQVAKWGTLAREYRIDGPMIAACVPKWRGSHEGPCIDAGSHAIARPTFVAAVAAFRTIASDNDFCRAAVARRRVADAAHPYRCSVRTSRRRR